MESFVTTHPFPSYAAMLRLIEGHPNMELSMAMWAEYGKVHHAGLQEAYESCMNPSIIRKVGETIHDLGGMQAMQMNYYVFANFAPFYQSPDPDIRYAYKELEYGWDGIGPWLA
jgi:hypothetical protein